MSSNNRAQGREFLYSLLSQSAYSIGSFFLLFFYSRFSASADFSLIAIYFLIINSFSSILLSWKTQLWRVGNSDQCSALWIFLITGLLASVVWSGYVIKKSEFGMSLVVSVVACFLFVGYNLLRRGFLLGGNVAKASLADMLRLLGVFAGIALASNFKLDIQSLSVTVIVSIVFPGIYIFGVYKKNINGFKAWCDCTAKSVFAIGEAGRKLLFVSGVNIFLSQLLLFVSPFYLSDFQYSSLRALDILLFPIFFIVQAIEPIVLRRLVAANEANGKGGSTILLGVFFVILIPFLIVCASVYFEIFGFDKILISPEYVSDKRLIVSFAVFGIALAIATTLRFWAISVARSKWLLRSVLTASIVSVLPLMFFDHIFVSAVSIVVLRCVYEIVVMLGSLVDLYFWRIGRNNA
ncbi:hypothetical protein KI614_02425 [Dechloromonas denitrificans]|uniref:hypothetical protein n=1 Tax=Dechloromonas denitrificans TaxID=281362 RepID=UPI001CF8FD99|nr:hypothetical protein [Dechloromonas denitrificans]UCV12116.1 hypothetical protein KI614_02425 [Dechloromonas denitrificans]